MERSQYPVDLHSRKALDVVLGIDVRVFPVPACWCRFVKLVRPVGSVQAPVKEGMVGRNRR